MPSQTLDLEARIKTLNTVLTEKHDRQTVDDALRAANGDMPAALAGLEGKLSGAALEKVALAHSPAVWSDDHGRAHFGDNGTIGTFRIPSQAACDAVKSGHLVSQRRGHVDRGTYRVR